MSREIEEMAKIMCQDAGTKNCNISCNAKPICDVHFYAERLYKEGYRKQSEGEWILTGTFKSTFPLPVADLHISCSVCGWKPPKYSDDYKEYKYCPHCGARMRRK